MKQIFIFRSKLFLFCAVLFFTGCATQKAAYYNQLNTLVAADNFSGAAAFAETSKRKAYGEKNALLYHLDRGFLLHCAGMFNQSNEAFEKAKSIAEEHFTKSITVEASSLLVNDAMRPYYGEDFERALIHVFSALNYMFMGKGSEALVEARQVDHFLKTLETNYGHKNTYREDPFARYLMGMIYENEKDYNNAYISYWQALQAYEKASGKYNMPVPQTLVHDTIKAAKKMGFRNEIKEIKKKWNIKKTPVIPSGYGEIILLHYNGISPVKRDAFFEISFGEAWGHVSYVETKNEEEADIEQASAIARSIFAKEQIRVAFPKYEPAQYRIAACNIEISTITVKEKSLSLLVDNIGGIAIQNLKDRIKRIRVRAIARAAVKYALAKKTSEKVKEQTKSDLWGWIAKTTLSIAASATETADKRSWRMLPDKILMDRISVPPGTYSIDVKFTDESGTFITKKTIENIVVQKNEKSFAFVRTTK